MAVLAKCRIPCYRRACVAVSMLLRLQYQIAKHAEIIQYSGLLLTQFLSVTINAMFWTIMNSWESVKVECMTTSLLVVILAYTIQNRWSLIVYWVTYFSLLIAHSNGTQITPLVHPTHPITITIFFPLAVMCSNVFLRRNATFHSNDYDIICFTHWTKEEWLWLHSDYKKIVLAAFS